MDEPFKTLLESFGIKSESCKILAFGFGHIHDTYLVERLGKESPPMILQQINVKVFKDVELLMHNLELISAHIAYKNRKLGKDPARNGILLLEAEEGKSYVGNEETGYWRMFWFIQDQVSFNQANSNSLAYEGGKAIAKFQGMLLDLDQENFNDIIPGFHDIRKRFSQFEEAIKSANYERLNNAEELINFSKSNYNSILGLYLQSENNNFPIRLTHNDTKFNNILFDKSGKATCLIDLDTVMKGFSWFDFGDALRTCASVVDEDETDLKKIEFRLDIFEGFSKGFLSEAKQFLSKEELSLLHLSPAYFTYMQGLRFLTDYLNNDIYYKTSSAEANLFRARGQYRLMQIMKDKEDGMAEILNNYLKQDGN